MWNYGKLIIGIVFVTGAVIYLFLAFYVPYFNMKSGRGNVAFIGIPVLLGLTGYYMISTSIKKIIK